MASTTVYLRKTSPGGDVYDTIAGAIAATSSGTGAEDRSLIIPLDSESYGQASFGALQWVDVASVVGSGCAPTFESADYRPIRATAGANEIRFIGDPGTPGLLKMNPGASSGLALIDVPAGCSFTVQDYKFDSPSGTGNKIVESAATGATYTFRRFDCVSGNWQSPVVGSALASCVIDDCDWLAMVGQAGPIVTTNTGVLDIRESWLVGCTLLGSATSLGTPAARHSVTTSVLVHNPTGAAYKGMIDLRADAGHSIGMDLFRVALIGDATPNWSGVYADYTTQDVRGCIAYNFETGWNGTGVWSPTYSDTWLCSAVVDGNVTPGTGMFEADPDWDGDYKPSYESPCVDAGTATGLTRDIVGNLIPVGTEDVGPYELQTRPNVTSASQVDRGTVKVLFDVAVYGTDLTDPTAWDLGEVLTTTDIAIGSVSVVSGTEVLLYTSELLLPDTLYRATAPATLDDGAGNLIDNRNGDFVTTPIVEPESGNPWSATTDADTFDIGAGLYELVPWAANYSLVSLREAVEISLFSDRRAEDDDVLPDALGDPPDVRGWPGDAYDATSGPIGSRLWLLATQPITTATSAKVREYCQEALAWMVTLGVAQRVDVQAKRAGMETIAVEIVISQADGVNKSFRFDDMWAAFRGE